MKDRNEVHHLGEHKKGAEPVFIPKIDQTSEDSGYVVGFVYDQEADKSEFIIIDAENFSEEPLAREFSYHQECLLDFMVVGLT